MYLSKSEIQQGNKTAVGIVMQENIYFKISCTIVGINCNLQLLFKDK